MTPMTIVGGKAIRIGFRSAGIVALMALSACFYDSRWGAAKQSQAAAMQRATPTLLHGTPPGGSDAEIASPRRAVRTLKIRARVTPRYAAEVLDWPRRLADTLDDAAEVLAPTLGIRLEIAATSEWTPRAPEEDLSALTRELAATDPAGEVDWVVGLVGSVPRFEESFHQLGMGLNPGKHLVMRAMNDAREYEAIERSFTEIDAGERRKLYRARRRHKAATVFLHELGHTLGLPHEISATTIMHHRYGTRVAGFSEAAVGLMRLSLEHRLEPALQNERAFNDAILAEVERSAASWVPDERDALLAKLRAATSPPPRRAGRPAAGDGELTPRQESASGEDLLASLSAADRATFNQALLDVRAGRWQAAQAAAKALVSAYPAVYAVQDLRCQIAMAAGGDFKQIEAECAAAMELIKAPGKKRAP
jgi:hypothetical protein